MAIKVLKTRAAGYAAAVAGIAAVIAVCAPMHQNFGDTTVALGMVLVVMLVAMIWGSLPALAASVVGMLGLNYFFLPPIGSLTIEDPANWIALTAFFATSITVGHLSARSKQRAGALAAERKRFLDVLDVLPAYIVLLTPDYRVAFANHFFRSRFGESQGRRCFEYLFGRSEPCEVCETFKVLHSMAPGRWEWTGPDGRNYDIFDFPFTDTDGSTLIMEMGLDVTEHKRADNEIRSLARLHAALAELGQRALSGNQIDEVLEEAVDLVARSLEIEYCKVLELLPGGEALLLRAGVGWKDGLVGHATVDSAPDSQAGFTLLSDRAVIVHDLKTEERFKGRQLLREHDVVSGASVLIRTSEGPYGVLGVHTRDRRTFSKDEVHFLESAANVLGNMIERQRSEAEIRRISRTNRALSRCNEAVIRATDEAVLLEQICRTVVEEAGYRFCWVGRAEHDQFQAVRPIAQAGIEEGYLSKLNLTWADTERGRGPTGTCIRTRQMVLARHIASDSGMSFWREEALKRGYCSSIAIPLLTDSDVFGALMIYAAEPDAFGAGEVALLTELANDLAFGIMTLRTKAGRARAEAEILALNAGLEQRVEERTAELQAANAALERVREREVEIGFRIQQTLLLDAPPDDVAGLRVAALSLPSQRIDGDFYAFFKQEDHCLDVMVGDVMGKGIPAALLGAATKSQFLTALSHLLAAARNGKVPEPQEIVMWAHAELVRQLIELDSFVTLCYARLDTNRRVLKLVDCGHTGTIHWHAGTQRCEVLRGDNLPLGVRRDEIYRQISVPFEPGDLFFFYSDGITEARNRSGELFGADRLQEAVRAGGELEPDALVDTVRRAVAAFSGSSRLADDLTGVAVRTLAQAEIDIRSDLTELRRAREFVRHFCQDAPGSALEPDAVSSLELAVHEAATNIMKHAYHGRADEWIHLEGEAFPGHVSIQLRHLGDRFEPSAVPPPAFDGSRESGFGTYMISRSVDEVRYYEDERGRSCVALVKNHRS